MRYAVSLTSIPPRFDRLAPVLKSLTLQDPAPARVLLVLPQVYHRFRGDVALPDLPAGVEIARTDTDLGPATKAIPAARLLAGQELRLIYCDDDWIYGPGWANALLNANPKAAATGQAWDVARIGRKGTGRDIAQGFSGVSVRPEWLCETAFSPPDVARHVDDIWLSALLRRQGINLIEVPAARAAIRPAFEDDTHALQHTTRDPDNRATAALVHHRFGIWPPL